MKITDAHVLRRLRSESNIWVATVRPDGRPHLTPTWFALHGEKLYISIDPASVKARNLSANPRVALALEDGAAPVIVEGEARPVEDSDRPQGALDEFKRKYDWNIDEDSQYCLLIAITPTKVLSWGEGE
ncbi:MAG TPA: pyridoxamine 5'-phosphate oxidase family protein [Anaerolineae bacterium]|nr:pyridoxamine 5'-phosphate oxidase family protein [Anaerolineae bacterium]